MDIAHHGSYASLQRRSAAGAAGAARELNCHPGSDLALVSNRRIDKSKVSIPL